MSDTPTEVKSSLRPAKGVARRPLSAILWWGAQTVGAILGAGVIAFGVLLPVNVYTGLTTPSDAMSDSFMTMQIMDSSPATVVFAGLFGLAFIAVGFYLLLYSIMGIAALLLEGKYGVVSVLDTGFISPSFMAVPVPWQAVRGVHVFTTYPFGKIFGAAPVLAIPIIMVDAAVLDDTIPWIQRMGTRFFSSYSRWFITTDTKALSESSPDMKALYKSQKVLLATVLCDGHKMPAATVAESIKQHIHKQSLLIPAL